MNDSFMTSGDMNGSFMTFHSAASTTPLRGFGVK